MTDRLDSRHLNVLDGLARGDSLDELADRLDASRRWVTKMQAEAVELLGARNGTHAVALAVALGFIDVDHGQHRRIARARRYLAEAAALLGAS